jgi:hypothetical protein
MAMVNGRAIKNAIKVFFKENGRDPSLEEFRNMVTGKATKKKVAQSDETQEKAS